MSVRITVPTSLYLPQRRKRPTRSLIGRLIADSEVGAIVLVLVVVLDLPGPRRRKEGPILRQLFCSITVTARCRILEGRARARLLNFGIRLVHPDMAEEIPFDLNPSEFRCNKQEPMVCLSRLLGRSIIRDKTIHFLLAA